MKINRFIHKETAFKTKTDRFISREYFGLTSKPFQKPYLSHYMENSGEYDV